MNKEILEMAVQIYAATPLSVSDASPSKATMAVLEIARTLEDNLTNSEESTTE